MPEVEEVVNVNKAKDKKNLEPEVKADKKPTYPLVN